MKFDHLAEDVLRELLLFLHVEDLHSVLLANRYLNLVADSETQWRLVYQSLATCVVTPAKLDDDNQMIVDSDDSDDVPPTTTTTSKDFASPLGVLRNHDKLFPRQTWKFNVQMTTRHRWGSFFIDAKGKKIMNPMDPIIDKSGKVLRFIENESERVNRIANTVRPINTVGTTRIDLKVQMCISDKSKASSVHSFCSSWVLLGIVEERILRKLYKSKKRTSAYLGGFELGENLGYANNGYFYRNNHDQWTDQFYSGDVITFIVDAEDGKDSEGTGKFGRLTCLLNGVELQERSFTGVFASSESRIYFCTQVSEACHENGITTTIQ